MALDTSTWITRALAAITSTGSFAPQAWKIIKTRETKDISTGMYGLTAVGIALWLAYGVMLGQWPLIATNSIWLVLAAFILVMKILPASGKRAVADTRRRVRVLVSSPSSASSGSEARDSGLHDRRGSRTDRRLRRSERFRALAAGRRPASVLTYMIHVDLWMAGTALALFVPQLVFVPLMQGAINRRTGARVQIIRQLSVSVIEATSGDDARDQTDDGCIDRVFELNMGIFRFKFTMNFLMNLSTQHRSSPRCWSADGWCITDRLEIGGVVAFISGIGRFTDPWGDLVNYFRDVNIAQVKFRLMSDAVTQQAPVHAPDKT
jgi:uncharacterized protein with PQ loop repeat